MMDLEDYQALARNIRIAQVAGTRLRVACKTAGIEGRTYLAVLESLGWRHS